MKEKTIENMDTGLTFLRLIDCKTINALRLLQLFLNRYLDEVDNS